MKSVKQLLTISSLAILLVVSSCSDDDGEIATLGVAFQTTALGLTSDMGSLDVAISFSRATIEDIDVTIAVTETGVIAGTDYSTTPAIAAGTLTINIPAGSESASFTINRTADVIAPGSSVSFALQSVDGETNVEISGNTELEVSFEAIVSAGSTIEASVGGPTQPNMVFVDFSLNAETAAARTSWDLGFYTGTEDKVIVNFATYGMAQALDKTDMNSVTAADTVGFAAIQTIGTAGAHIYIDNPDRDLDKLAIADISATDSENNVYIINRGFGPGTGDVTVGSVNVDGTERGWKKIRILKSGNDYVIQHADIAATTFEEVTVTKDPTTNFVFFNFEDGSDITVEPAKDRWDIVFAISSNIIDFGAGDGAYGFSDFILSNRQGGVQIAAVDMDHSEFDNFGSSDLTSMTFSEAGNIIGSNWRIFDFATFGFTINTSVFYVLEDSEGNFYKFRFTKMYSDQGERGYPEVAYELIQ